MRRALMQQLPVLPLLLLVLLLPLSSHAQQQRFVPPALSSALEKHAAALRGRTAAAAVPLPPAANASSDSSSPLQQQWQQQRHLLAPAADAGDAGVDAAAGEKPAKDPRFANLTVGNATAARENALRAALLDGYERGNFPYSEFGPANVTVDVALHKILDVDLYGGTLKMAVWLRLNWVDPRLSWDAKEWNVTRVWFMNPQPGDTEIWEPDVTLWNAATPILYTLSQEPFNVQANGKVGWSRPGVFEAACNFKGLSAFPFGRVRCELELGSWSYGPWYVNVSMQGKGYTVGGSITSGETSVWTEYRIGNVTAKRHTYPPYPCCPDESDWPVVLIDMALERQNLIYMMKVIVPQIILTAVAFSTFWLSPACGERLGLAVTVPLAVAVYDLLTFSQLPVSNKVTLVSAMGMTAFLFSMAVLLENAFVIQLWHYTEATYFKGASVLAATAVAYREQLVWVHLLGCIQQLKIELARRQLAALQGRKPPTTPRSDKSHKDKSWHSPRNFLLPTTSSGNSPALKLWDSLIAEHQQHQQQQPQPQQQQRRPVANGAAAAAAAAAAGEGEGGGHASLLTLKDSLYSSQSDTGAAAAAAGARAANPQASDDVSPARLDVIGSSTSAFAAADSSGQQQQQQETASAAVAAAGAAAPPGRRSMQQQLSLVDRAKQHVRLKVDTELGELEARMGVDVKKADESSDALLLRVTTKDQLRSHLHAILASPDKSLATIRRRIAKAFLVFGEDTTCARLHATLVGGGPGQQGPEAAAAAASDSGVPADLADVSPQGLHARLAGEFNRRWQLLSTMIDHTCRYVFVIGYVISMLITITVLITADE